MAVCSTWPLEVRLESRRNQIDSLVLDGGPGLRVRRDTLWGLLSALSAGPSGRLGLEGPSAYPVLPHLLERKFGSEE